MLVLPAMSAVRHSTMQKALEFHRHGGMVIAVGAVPEASERVGRDDPELDAMVREVFGVTASEPPRPKRRYVQHSAGGEPACWSGSRRKCPRSRQGVYTPFLSSCRAIN